MDGIKSTPARFSLASLGVRALATAGLPECGAGNVLKVVSFNQNDKDLLGCYIKQIMNVFHSCNGAKCSFVESWNVPFNSAPPR